MFCRERNDGTLLRRRARNRNGGTTPDEASHGGKRHCAEGYNWEAPAYVRTAGRGCAGKRLSRRENDPASMSAARHVSEQNGGLRPDAAAPNPRVRVWRRRENSLVRRTTVFARRRLGNPACAGRTQQSIADGCPELARTCVSPTARGREKQTKAR